MQNLKGFIILLLVIMYSFSAQAQVVNKVVAVVNDEVVTRQDVDQLLAVMYAQHVQAYTGDELLQKMEELKKDILRRIIEDKLILSRARELRINVTEGDILDKLESIKSAFPSEEEFFNTLNTQGITVANLKGRYRDQILMRKVVNLEVRSRVSVVPSEISEYYEKHREDFKQDEKYKVRHILIKASDDVEFELAKVEITDIYDRLEAGQDFGALARQHSQGPNKERGGDMGYIARNEMLQDLDAAIFSLKSGEFSSPIKTQIGYHIVKVEDIKYSGYLSLDDTKKDIKDMLFTKKLQEKLSDWLTELRTSAYISIK
ncbi:MAG: peptidylprolyl isomerase [Candidatus Gorgyraea atricola]|nr:peptidylprolyl isomerase [Candidatus Gorgyraea atricola]